MANEQRPPNAAQALAKQQFKSISQSLKDNRESYLKVIPRHLDADRMLRVALSAISRDKNLLACTEQSLMRSVMAASVLGLEIGVLGEAYLIPFKTEATMIPGYQGLIKLAIQSKAVAAVNVGAVYPGDDFDYGLGSEPFVRHKPSLKAKVPGTLIAAYCVVKLVTGEFQATIMGKEEVDAIRARSRSGGNGPWVTDYEQMAIKTAIRRALKYVPKTPQLSRALEVEDRTETGASVQEIGDVFPELDGVVLPGEVVSGGRQSTVDAAAEALGAARGGTATDVAGLNAEADAAAKRQREPGEDG
jgi:recombination protein RecT